MKLDFDIVNGLFPTTRVMTDYRIIDASSVGKLARHWKRPGWEALPPKASDHTAMADIREGIMGAVLRPHDHAAMAAWPAPDAAFPHGGRWRFRCPAQQTRPLPEALW
ncbi:hypothetical protein [Arthrobacter mobilis]|uniref:Uncharacterized protein n=1 Tax=Arthrobacter mobilis TaxID=2724944 RepID=A0A7X6HH83_9MICC|nr:hypothetical protein [Arthrobacter mobilis]NKX55986.1 hypothetical protein [Arthrobacter mobilis]